MSFVFLATEAVSVDTGSGHELLFGAVTIVLAMVAVVIVASLVIGLVLAFTRPHRHEERLVTMEARTAAIEQPERRPVEA